MGGIKLCLFYIHGSMNSFLDAVNILNNMCKKLNIKIDDICQSLQD